MSIVRSSIFGSCITGSVVFCLVSRDLWLYVAGSGVKRAIFAFVVFNARLFLMIQDSD